MVSGGRKGGGEGGQLKNKKVGGHAAEDQNQMRTSIGKYKTIPDQSTQSFTVIILLVKNNKGRGGGGGA